MCRSLYLRKEGREISHFDMNKSFEAQPMQITADNLSNGGIHLVSRMKNEFAWKKYCYRAKVNCFIVLWQKEQKRVLLLRLKYTLHLIWAYVSLKKSRIIQTAVISFHWKSNLTVKANLITFMSWLWNYVFRVLHLL